MVRSYRDLPSWLDISVMVPERNRIPYDAQPEETYWKWGSHEIHIDYYRRPEAKAKVILLHGVGGNGRILSFVGAPLWGKGFEVIAPDLPPYGLSLTDPRTPVDYHDWVRLVSDLINAESKRDSRPIFLFGLSAAACSPITQPA